MMLFGRCCCRTFATWCFTTTGCTTRRGRWNDGFGRGWIVVGGLLFALDVNAATFVLVTGRRYWDATGVR